MTLITALSLLFGAAFMAATVIPSQSEWILFAFLKMEKYPASLLIIVATTGNVLGSVVNWWLGRFITRFEGRKWFPVSPPQMRRGEKLFEKYGTWALLLAWVPFIGDPLTVIAGALRVRFDLFLLLVTVGKGARYLFIWAVYAGFF